MIKAKKQPKKELNITDVPKCSGEIYNTLMTGKIN